MQNMTDVIESTAANRETAFKIMRRRKRKGKQMLDVDYLNIGSALRGRLLRCKEDCVELVEMEMYWR